MVGKAIPATQTLLMAGLWEPFLLDHCKEINQTDLEACIANDSYGLTDFLAHATFGVLSEGLNETEWTWGVVDSGYGRYFTWNPQRRIIPDYLTGYVNMRGYKTFRFYVFVHDFNFFFVNANPFGPTKSFWEFDGNAVQHHYQEIFLVRHKKLNLDHKPCKEADDYNFGKCVKESLVQQVGCKRPWDRESKDKMCTKKEQFTQFDNLYDQYMKMESDEVVSLTGCLKPCEYKEYKIINSNLKTATALTHVPDKEISFGLWAVSKYTEYEEEVLFWLSNKYPTNIRYCFHINLLSYYQVLLYPFTSLLAEFGGCLGLFLGFSFVTVSDGMKVLAGWLRKNINFF